MLDVCLLGTGGMMPLPNRWLTSLVLRFNGSSMLIDCGEGTQIAMREAGLSPYSIDIICFTHYHADHISGLPGMLLNMANAGRTKPVTMIGPRGLTRVVTSLRVIASELPFPIQYIELAGRTEDFELHGFEIHAFRASHNVVCYGYSVGIPRQGRFDAQAARQKGIPLMAWNRLQHGQTVRTDNGTYTPDMVMGPPRRGIKVTYCTDSRPTQGIVEAARGSDLFICEGMYGDDAEEDKARQKKHMLFSEAAHMAREAGVKELWLTHFSPSLVAPERYLKNARGIFENTSLGRDGRMKELDFPEEDA